MRAPGERRDESIPSNRQSECVFYQKSEDGNDIAATEGGGRVHG